MTDGWRPPSNGALDETAWPDQLVARVIDAGDDDDRLHGYAVLADVARNHSYADLVYLSIVGQLPSALASARFHAAMCAAAPVGVQHASTHTAVLARLSGSTLASAMGAALIVAADHARQVVAEHAELSSWLASGAGPVPAAFQDPAAAAWVANLTAAIAPDARIDLATLSRDAAMIALFHAAGVISAEQLEAAITTASITGIVGEALATGPQHLADYPVKLPPYRYVEDA